MDGAVDSPALQRKVLQRINGTLLSLKDPVYREAMFALFRTIADGSREELVRLAEEAHRRFKAGGGRFYKHQSRGDGGYLEVNEADALESALDRHC